jgi:uncharacterized protein YfaS (alpha-2-macroglobulin family)
MQFRKITALIIVLILNLLTVKAQTGDYGPQWKKITDYENKGLTKNALDEVVKIFNDAVKTGNEPQQIKAAMYQMKYRNMTEEDNAQKNIFFADTLIAKAKAPAKNILQSMQAQLLETYRNNNRWKLYNRTATTDENGNDIATWSLTKLNEKIASLYKASLKNDDLLKSASLKGYTAVIEKGKNTESLRPTLYDLLAHRALDFFMSTENDVTQASYKFIINDEAAFAPVSSFVSHKFISKDTASLYLNALAIMQDLLRFHLNDAQPDALIDADLKRLDFVNDHGVFNNKAALYEAALQNIESKYGNSPASAQASYLRALTYSERGNTYDPITNPAPQSDLVKAKQICETAYAKFPKSEGGINCKNLISEITQPSLHFQTEKVNLPAQPFRSFVQYKNTQRVYFRIVKTSREQIKALEENVEYDKVWAGILKLSSLKSWTAEVPDQKDFQQHAVEIKIDALPQGMYYVLTSLKEDFSLANNIIGRSVAYVSNISYIINNKSELYALDRDNGQPLANAAIQLWKNNYNYTTRKYEQVKASAYATDKNGFAKLAVSKNYENNIIQIKYNGDELFTDDGVNTYYYNYYDQQRKGTKRTFIFTDRSIYRPGQTVFFKGIMTATDSTGRKSEIIAGRKTAVQLLDNNNQKVASVNVVSNEFGSYNGSFKIPEGLLTGNFSLQDTLTKSTQNFSVEEYKRPKFSAEIKKPEGSYRVNDSIKVTGIAKAYAGNNIDGAKVAYRVVRIVRYPIWYGYYRSIWPPRGNNEEMEITNGETVTDAKGEFTVTFKAIPDETVEKKSQPTFEYRITADVTDVNGETRSGSQLISVSYQALQLNITGDAKLPADSLKNIGVSSTNANGLHEKATVNFAMYRLQEPDRIFRTRYWEMPDRHTMTKEEYYRNFPYDAYADEDQMAKWPLGEKVIDKTDTTASNSSFVIGRSSLSAGWYKIIVTTKDKFGEDVKAEKFVQITSGGKEKIRQPILVTTENDAAEPGGKITYNISTGFDKVWLIQNIIRPDEKYKITYPTVSAGETFTNTIEVNETDRGGINMNYAFVQHNRMYTGGENFAIPWNNKDVKIAYETFRDKLQPGSEEKWKIKITGDKAEKVAAESLISMYDASLDQFKPHEWGSLSSLWPGVNSMVNWTGETFRAIEGTVSENFKNNVIPQPEKSYPYLTDNGWNDQNISRIYRMGKMADRGGMRDMAAAAPVLSQKNLEGNVAVTSVTTALGVRRQPKELGYAVTVLKDSTNSEINPAEEPINDSSTITIRKNFNETAFFFPDLKTDANGNIEFSFTIPEALTKWKLMVMAHTKELASAYSTRTTVTQKELMVQPNAPRFLREGDRMEFSAKIVNLTDKEITGASQLELLNAATNAPVDGWFKNVFPNQYFTVPAGQSVAVKFPMDVPFNFNSAMIYRIKAISKDGSFSDGEEMALPVLTNRTLVTETMPLNMRNSNSKTFKFDKLLTSGNSGSLTNHALTVEYTSNPAWYAVQALPYLMEYPYECAEQNFNRYYANALASYISNSSPKIKEVFEKWKITDTAALMSNLQKNEELKSVLLQETPWVLNAQSEAQQKKNIALLFDMVRLAGEKNKTLAKLKEMQSSNGGFAWFKGGADDRYMTQYIITGIGHLRKLGALQGDDYAAMKPIADKALPYLDARLKDEYDNLVKHKLDLTKNNLSYTAIQYLYMRSFFSEVKVSDAAKKAVDYYKGQSVKYWLSQSRYMQAMIALAAGRSSDEKTAKAIIESLKQNAITTEEMGMYWKDLARGGYYWYQAPIESQAMMIEAFTDIDKNTATVNDLKTWLLKQKQTQQWPTTKATAEACYALLLNGSNWLAEEKAVTIQLGNTIIKSTDEKSEAGTGYFKKRIEGDKVQQGMGNITVSISSPTNQPVSQSTSWGGVYWQYFEDLDKITASETPVKLVKQLFIERNSDKGPVLEPIKDGAALKVGDKIKVRIELRADRDMEYVHMKDMRAACMEPTNVISQYKWQGGLGYYESTKDASTNFFFGWLPKGTYVFEYPMFVTLNGNFSNGITTIQCMYAPEFTSHSEGVRVSVGE